VFYCNKKEQNTCSKGSAFASSEAFPPIFQLILLTGAQECFLPQGAGHPSYATDDIFDFVLFTQWQF